MEYHFEDVARLPHPDDNAAIATRRLEANTKITYQGAEFSLTHTVLEGHRFAIQALAAGSEILSWELPFGMTTGPIQPGAYLCNAATLAELRSRSVSLSLPTEPNFTDIIRPVSVNPDHIEPSPVTHYTKREATKQTFLGYKREGIRGVGTRNTIVIIATTADSAGFVRRLATKFQNRLADYPHIDAIHAIAHTEGDRTKINNRQLLQRTLLGWMAHPNVAAAMLVDFETESGDRFKIKKTARNDDRFSSLLHSFFTIRRRSDSSLAEAAKIIEAWLPQCNDYTRTPQPVSALKIALQCGGSDAFSGISGNPLAGWVAKEVIKYGGAANLAETDELMGAEPYILRMCRDLKTAERFLTVLNRFRSWAHLHGVSPEGNPSGGNRFRGLYNIALKSIGAANKKDPELPLDHVINYSQPMNKPGFYFMDSPGNDLESIAGQVAAGCNLIFFVTGNGSITNFPFVPTLKIVTTTKRFEQLEAEMDINAGAYLDGEPFEAVGAEAFKLALATASGRLSAGEKAGHAQVQIWRDWSLNPEESKVEENGLVKDRPQPTGLPLTLTKDLSFEDQLVKASDAALGFPQENDKNEIALILPTSLCSGEIAKLAVARLNEAGLPAQLGVTRFETLAHTEGCGFSSGSNDLFMRTMVGYLKHPLVKHALLLEHGCEKTHNDYFQQYFKKADLQRDDFGWASIQQDGGIDAVFAKMETWFRQIGSAQRNNRPRAERPLSIALIGDQNRTDEQQNGINRFVRSILNEGGSVILPQKPAPLRISEFIAQVENDQASGERATLGYGQRPAKAGLHIMASYSGNWAETISGLGACGPTLILSFSNGHPRPGHPFIPTLQLSWGPPTTFENEFDLSGPYGTGERLNELVRATLTGEYRPMSHGSDNRVFQMTRGRWGISL